jgi:PAS domain S-box-containing protein
MVERGEAQFRGLLEAAPDAIVVLDDRGHISLVNAQVERLFGYARRELVGRPIEVLIPEWARAVHPRDRRGYLTDPRPRPIEPGMELTARRKNGEDFPAEIYLSPIETEEGQLVAAAIRDASKRKRAEEAQAWLASIVQCSHDAIVGKSLDGAITSWNPGAERLYGYAAEEMIGHRLDVVIPPDSKDEEAAMLGRVVHGKSVEQYQSQRVHKDGHLIDVSVTLSAIAYGNLVVGVASIVRDVTERQRADVKLRGLLDAAPDAVLGLGADGRIVLVNAQVGRLFGYRRDELIGQPVEILVPGIPVIGRAYFAERDPRPKRAGMQLAARRKDGTEFPAEISLSSLETQEGLLVSAAVRDVSERIEEQAERERLKAQAERERLERRLHQSQRLESLGQLAGGVAHDFNNLLAVILNYTAFIAENLDAPPNGDEGKRRAAVRQDVEQVQRAAERATRLTHQLLAFARREVVRPELLSLNNVISEMEQLLRQTIGEHVELVTSLDPDLSGVMADPGQIEQVLVNLAVNARDAMPAGGELKIDTDNLWIDEEYAARRPGISVGPHVRLRVSDTGTGMERDVAARAFEPFFSKKSKGEGSGLGLATVYGIVTQAGGDAQLFSEPGTGTTFSAVFPTAHERAAQEQQPGGGPSVGRGETVLIVEDEEAMREVTRRILTRNGYAVLTAAGGSEALTLAAEHAGDIHLLVTDVVMPQMLGKEVAERVTSLRPDIRVLYMSGYAHPVLASNGTLDTGVTLLEKPFTEAALLAKARKVLEEEPAASGRPA